MPGSDQTTTTTSEPWGPAQGNLRFGLDQVRRLYDAGGLTIDPFQGQRTAGPSNATLGAQQGIMDIANGQGEGLSQALQTAVGQAQGTDAIYRDLDEVKQSALESTLPSVMAAFGGQGMTDSSTARQEAATAAARAIAPIEYGAFNQAQDRSLRAAGMIPGLSQAQFLPQQMIGQVGQQQEGYQQRQIDADMARYYEEQNAPIDALNRFSQLSLGYGGVGRTTTETQPGPSGLERGLGFLSTGAGLYGALAGNPLTAPFALGTGAQF